MFSFPIFVFLLGVPYLVFSQNNIPTEGPGCDVLRSSLIRDTIPFTSLYTGTFYSVRLKSKNPSPNDPYGYLTWTSKEHESTGHKYVFADSNHDMSNYKKGGKWQGDSQWAFLISGTPGWYRWINCGYSSYYATWSGWQEDEYDTDKYALILDKDNASKHSFDDFLFKPVLVSGNVYHIVTKGLGGGVVTESNITHNGPSNYLQIEKGPAVVIEKDEAGFIFEVSNDASGQNRDRGSGKLNCVMLCSCTRKVVFGIFTTLCGIASLGGFVWIYKPDFIYKRFR